MLLDEQARGLTRTLKQLAQRKQASRQAGALRKQRERVSEATEKLRRAREVRARVSSRASSEPEALPYPEASQAREKAEALRAHFEAGNDLSSGTVLKEALDEAKTATGSFETGAAALWRQATGDAGKARVAQLRNVFGQLPKFASHVQELDRIQQRLSVLAASVPTSDEDADRFFQLKASLQRKFEQLPDVEDEEVNAFLKAAARPSGASLSLLTPRVTTWLAEKGLADAFAIRAK